jgi:hypothetical protein
MKKDPDSAKRREEAFIAAARKELATLKPAAAAVAPPRAAGTTAAPEAPPKGAAVPRRDPPAAAPRRPVAPGPTTPLDGKTVDGWNHPAARDTEPKVKIAAEEKWARVAAAMEAEALESRQARERVRRMGRRIAIGAAVVIFLVVITVLH